MNILLSGIVGSTAYGLSRPGSDIDRLGIFAAPTSQFHGLHRPKESIVTKAPDTTYHEAAKWCRLALSGNPTVFELVWLPDHLYEVRTRLGQALIAIRSSFLCAPRVRDAYLGYATQQFVRIKNRGDGSFSADTRKRTEKHARHLMRLCHQGYDLYSTGRLQVRVKDPDRYFEFGEAVADTRTGHGIGRAEKFLDHMSSLFDSAVSPLPQYPDEGPATDWLHDVRKEFYE